MSGEKRAKPVTVPKLAGAPGRGEKIVMTTAYDYPQARLVDEAGVDVVLVGDSLAMVVLGHDDTLSVTMDEMLHHVKAVRRGLERALLVADMPYGSFHLGAEQAVENALRFVKQGGAQAVKIEGGRPEIVEALTRAEIPVMGHLGLTPQSLHRFGGYRIQGRGEESRAALIEEAHAIEEAGAFSLVLECVPAELGGVVSEQLEIPTIGIGAGPDCDGQVLVFHDLLGLEDRLSPKFVRRYAELGKTAAEAYARFIADVREGRFPSAEESYDDPTRETEGPRRIYG
jgi:3-methyl-2-oxobutanoate hydroxymethyltransferase